MKRIIFFLFIASFISCNQNAHTCALKGIKYKGIDEIPSLQSYIGYDVNTVQIDYGNYYLSLCSNEENSLILFEIVHLQPDGQKVFEILDTVNTGPSNTKQGVYLYGCELNNIIDHRIFATIKHPENSSGYFEIIKAWKADTITNVIVPILNLEGLVCADQIKVLY